MFNEDHVKLFWEISIWYVEAGNSGFLNFNFSELITWISFTYKVENDTILTEISPVATNGFPVNSKS